MTNKEAIMLLNPKTTASALAEIEYYNGFKGKEACIKAIEDACRLAIEALEKQATTQATSEWIPVSERLPENISTVIVQLKEVEKPTLGWFGNLTGWRLTENDYLGLTGFSVIAWQPLPEPWKENIDGRRNI